MLRIAVLGVVTAAVVTTTLLGGVASATTAPGTCDGYPQPRVFLESQAWWKTAPAAFGSDFGHVHSGTCFPYLQDISGVVPFDVVTKLHDNPGLLTRVEVQAFNSAYGTKNLTSVAPKFVCASNDCTVTHTLSPDTRLLAYDGLTEFRIRSHVREPDGNVMIATDGWLAYVRNGRPVVDSHYLAPGMVEARGWYGLPGTDGLGYVNARLRSRLPSGPVSGVWRPEVQTVPGVGPSRPISRTLVTVDPNFHAVPESSGWVQVRQSGPYRGFLTIDTTKLANGPHKLVVIASTDQLVFGSTQSGVAAIPFTVQN